MASQQEARVTTEPVRRFRPMVRVKGKVRTCDPETAAAINAAVDEAIKYRPYNFITNSFRANTSGAYSAPVKFFKSIMKQLGDKRLYETNAGQVSVEVLPSYSERMAFAEEAMANLGIELNFEVLVGDSRFVLDIDTTGMKQEEEVTQKVRELCDEFDEKYFNLIEVEGVDDSTEESMVKRIASSATYIRDILANNRKYLQAYNEAKRIFSKASGKDGNFQRVYYYRGVAFGWKEIAQITSPSQQIKAYLDTLDLTMKTRFKNELVEINKRKNNNLKIRMLLDNVDYFAFEDPSQAYEDK